MVSKYLKALVLTIFLFVAGMALIGYLDNQRFASISKELDSLALDAENMQQLLFYESVSETNEEICPVLSTMIDSQVSKTRAVLLEFESAKSQNFLADSELLKRKYIAQNVRLYLLAQKYTQRCETDRIIPVVYFYTDKTFNAQEAAQQKVLDGLVAKCPALRVFALPHDMQIPVADLLVSKYNITVFPTILLNGEKFEGLQSESSTLFTEKLSCHS